MEHLQFISASAGAGKTWKLVESVYQAVSSGAARAEGVVATTFSNPAANDLRERLAERFFAGGRHDDAAQLDEGLIGTVHSICLRLLTRFAFEAGMSPELRILDDTETRLLLDRALDDCVDEALQLELCRLGDRLEQLDRNGAYQWRQSISAIIGAARTNNIAPEALAPMGEASWNELAAALPPATEDDVVAALREQIDIALAAIPDADKPKNSANYRRLLEDFLRAVDQRRAKWSDWAALRSDKKFPAKAFHPVAQAVAEAADRLSEHAPFQEDLKAYLEHLFRIAGAVAARFQALKRERGAVDFDDMEKDALDLLRSHESVREILRDEIDLLLVDEFQDTSPIQLAVFAELGALAKQVIWVGDVKQSIYEFRGADPDLVFRAVENATNVETLAVSWRSTPDLVSLANQLFAEPFLNRLGLAKDRTVIRAHRDQVDEIGPALEIATIESNRIKKGDGLPHKLVKNERPSLIADVVQDVLQQGGKVIEKSSVTPGNLQGSSRPVTARDVAVLTREKRTGDAVALELRRRGIDVSRASKGLLETAEARLAIACLRRLTDRADSLATAEIVALENLTEPEEWITSRLEFLDEQDDPWATDWAVGDSPAVTALQVDDDSERLQSPLEAFDRAIDLADVPRIIAGWGPSQARVTQRNANLERLRAFIQDYETKCGEFGLPATLNGLFGWLEQLSADGLDHQGIDPETDAVHIGTCHASKGREWPIVVVTDPDYGLKTRLFDLRVVMDPDAGNEQDPLAGRELRLWVNPSRRSQLRFHEQVENSAIGRQATESAQGEELRLLYVTLTRARDRMIIVRETGQAPEWLSELGPPGEALLSAEKDSVKLSDAGEPIPLRTTKFVLGDEIETLPSAKAVRVAVQADAQTPRLPAVVTPSAQSADAAAKVLKVHEFGSRLPMNKHPDERDLGDALHRILAAEAVNPNAADRERRYADILESFNLLPNVEVKDVLRMVDRYREFVRKTFLPQSEAVETPFSVTNPDGQLIHGLIDHLLQNRDGQTIIDHKIFPGRRDQWESKALSYAGQLACYRNAVGGKARTFIHFASLGVLVEIGNPPTEKPAEEDPNVQGTFDFG